MPMPQAAKAHPASSRPAAAPMKPPGLTCPRYLRITLLRAEKKIEYDYRLAEKLLGRGGLYQT